MWLKINEPLKDNCLMNIPYNPSTSLCNFFWNKLSAEVSNAYSLRDNCLLFGDYNIDQFKEKMEDLLNNFTSGLALDPKNVDTPNRIINTNQSLIDRCFMAINQIVEWKVFLPPIDVSHNIIFYQSNLEMIGRKEDNYYFRRNIGENSTGIWLLRTGDLCINRKIVMKCLQN